jgi:hypothetical protein
MRAEKYDESDYFNRKSHDEATFDRIDFVDGRTGQVTLSFA